MTEDDAKAWIAARFGYKAVDKLAMFADFVSAESERQNLVAPSTLNAMWTRHLLDSAQLVPLAPAAGTWIDIGTGAGFPGLVVASLRSQLTICIEPRRLRAEFLMRAADHLNLMNVSIRQARVEQVSDAAVVVSARAVAPVEKLLQMAAGCATTSTRWLLPRGRLEEAEIAAARRRWKGTFHVEQSLSDPTSRILVIDGLSPLQAGRR